MMGQKLNPCQQRRKAQHELHAATVIHARLLGIDVPLFRERTRQNIHCLQVIINKESSWRSKN